MRRVTGPPWHGVLIDIDGVLHVGADPIDGAGETLNALRAAGLPFRLVTNTTSRSRRLVVERLLGLGFEIAEPEVLTPAALAVRHCQANGYERVAVHVASALREDVQQLSDWPETTDVDAVVLGDLGEEFSFARLNQIFRQLQNGAELVALQRNRVWQREDGLSLDAGPFVVALEYAVGREATVTGKPSPAFFEAALSELGVPASDVVMIGDDVEADVGGALDAGLDGVLVRTGKFREDAVLATGIKPTLVLDSIADLIPLL
jgi:phospholysine phosphohistidine inorganic pyrophosphate phosphatase